MLERQIDHAVSRILEVLQPLAQRQHTGGLSSLSALEVAQLVARMPLDPRQVCVHTGVSTGFTICEQAHLDCTP